MNDIISNQTIERVKRDNCFDFLRYLFAFSLILVHFCTLTGTEQFWFISGQMRVKAFFTITGFLVVYSYIRRKTLKVYCWKRILRIIPAYFTTILLCYILGYFFSTANISEYYCSSQSLKYLMANLSFMNFIEPCLPGLFTDNLYGPFVNGSLWSMKLEIIFYIFVPFMIWLMRKYNKMYVILTIFAFNTIFHAVLNYLDNNNGSSIYHTINNSSPTTMIYFFSGTTLLLYFNWFCKHIKWTFSCCLIYVIVTLIFDYSLFYYLEPLAFSGVIVGIAYFCKPLNILRKYDNISYGLYLYHFPVIQVLVQYRLHQYNIYITFILTILITVILAIISWYLLEKPMLKMKIS